VLLVDQPEAILRQSKSTNLLYQRTTSRPFVCRQRTRQTKLIHVAEPTERRTTRLNSRRRRRCTSPADRTSSRQPTNQYATCA